MATARICTPAIEARSVPPVPTDGSRLPSSSSRAAANWSVPPVSERS